MTINGKLDRAALPDPQYNMESGTAYTSPQNEVEQIMADIWSELLGREGIGIHDNFFDVGGNSLLLIRMFSRLEKKFPGQLSVSELFSYTTIAQLSTLLGGGGEDPAVPIGFVTLPDRFIVRGGGAAGVFRFALPVHTSRGMTAIAERAGVQPATVLIALFGLLLNEYSGAERILLNAMVTERLKVSALKLDFSNVTELNALIEQTQAGLVCKDGVGSLQTAPASRPSFRDIAPLFYDMDLYEQSASMTAVYDIALGLHREAESGVLAFLFEYSSTMNAQQMRQATQNYLELAELLVENEQSSVR